MGSCLNIFRRDDVTGIIGFYLETENLTLFVFFTFGLAHAYPISSQYIIHDDVKKVKILDMHFPC